MNPIFRQALFSALLAVTSLATTANVTGEAICAYAPSQSRVVQTLSAAFGGTAAAALAVTQATGLTAVLHSSGAYIFTGSSGYIAGTIGGAVAVPAIYVVTFVLGVTTVAVELVCAPKNHPKLAAKIAEAAREFVVRSRQYIHEKKSSAAGERVSSTTVAIKRVAGDVFEYARNAVDRVHPR